MKAPLTAHIPRLFLCSDTPRCSESAGHFLPAAESHNRERYPQTRHLRPGSTAGGDARPGGPPPSSTASSAAVPSLACRGSSRTRGIRPFSAGQKRLRHGEPRRPLPQQTRPPRSPGRTRGAGAPGGSHARGPRPFPPPGGPFRPPRRSPVAASPGSPRLCRAGARGRKPPTWRGRKAHFQIAPQGLPGHWLRSAAPAQEAPPPGALETSDSAEKLPPIGCLASGLRRGAFGSP